MKKLVFLFVAFAAVSLASCGNKAANTDNTDATDNVEVAAPVEEVAADSTANSAACDSTTAVAE